MWYRRDPIGSTKSSTTATDLPYIGKASAFACRCAEREHNELRPISVKGVGDKDAGAKNYKKRCYNFEHGAALEEIIRL
jgi:hypothetical protein